MTPVYRLPDTVETQCYSLRKVEPSDAFAMFERYTADVAVTRHLGWVAHASREDTATFVKRASAEWETGRGFPLVVFERARPDDLIGMFHPHVSPFKVNDGYVLAQDAWGRGCATEILTWLVDHALAHPAIHRAEAFCDVDNLASARVMEKAGLMREGLLRRYFVHPNVSPTPRDCVMYAKVR